MSTNLPSSVGEVLQTICVRGFQLSVSYAWALAPRYFIPESWHDKSTAYWQFLLLTQVTSQIFFHTVGLSYTLLDYVLERRGTISKYKIQPEANVPIDWKKYRHVIWIANRNSLVVQAPMSALFSLFFVRLNMDIWPGPLPPVYFTLLRIAAASVVGEFIFYHVHWWMHKGGHYQQLHKMHHEWVAPVAYANVYCTMFEHVFQNVLSIYAGALFFSHIVEVGVFLNLVSLNSFASHSGYKLPIGGNGNHDMHHTNVDVNYGIIMLFDKLYGTFKAVPQEQTLLETATKSPLTLRYGEEAVAVLLNMTEAKKHNTEDDCWIVIADKVLDITEFLSKHPGGKQILMLQAGNDATQEFNKRHTADLLKRYVDTSKVKLIGMIGTTVNTPVLCEDYATFSEEPSQQITEQAADARA